MRDIDLFDSINRKAKGIIQMSLTVADDWLSRILEPNVCTTSRRYEVLKEFQKRSIPTVVWMTPILPFLTDTEDNMRTILNCCFDAGVKGIILWNAGMTLRDGNREYYFRALDRHFPGLAAKYCERYGNAYEINSQNNEKLMKMFHDACEKYDVIHNPEKCFHYIAELPEQKAQLSLFME